MLVLNIHDAKCHVICKINSIYNSIGHDTKTVLGVGNVVLGIICNIFIYIRHYPS